MWTADSSLSSDDQVHSEQLTNEYGGVLWGSFSQGSVWWVNFGAAAQIYRALPGAYKPGKLQALREWNWDQF